MLYESKIKCCRVQESDGMPKMVTEVYMQGTMAGWELKSITETKILEVYSSKSSND